MTPEERILQLEHQQAIQTEAIKAFLDARFTGPGSVQAYLLALNPNWKPEDVPVAPFGFDA